MITNVKYGRMQKRIPSRLVCGSCGVCLDCTLPGDQVTAGMGFFSAFRSFMYDCENSDSLLYKAQPSLQVPSGIVNDLMDDIQKAAFISGF